MIGRMAPRPPWSRQGVVQYLRGPGPHLPLLLGSPHLHGGVAVVREEGVYRLRRLACDEAGLEAFREQQHATGKPFYPEHVDQFQRPTGAVLAEAASLDDFVTALEGIPWEPGW